MDLVAAALAAYRVTRPRLTDAIILIGTPSLYHSRLSVLYYAFILLELSYSIEICCAVQLL